jgi:hypothetical protein
MYISNMTHFLDETGNIPTKMPKPARELAGFHALVVDATSKEKADTLVSTGLRCFTKKCIGLIESEIMLETDEIHWFCTECDKEGFISSWQGTKWDNRS